MYTQLLKLLSYPIFSSIVGFVVAFPWPKPIVRFFIKRIFIKGYGVNWQEAEKPVEAYRTIVSFFIRKLKPNARSIQSDQTQLISPVDGRVMSFGTIREDISYRVKGKDYPLIDLIGSERLKKYREGSYVVLYLSPKDYHRIHHIDNAFIEKAEYFPGKLLPVNLHALTHFKNVFGKNKRVLIEYDKPFGMVMVGALNVGKIVLSNFPDFYKQATINNSLNPKRYELKTKEEVNRGDEAGIFYLGSTVVLFFKKNLVHLDVKEGQFFYMGESIGRWLNET